MIQITNVSLNELSFMGQYDRLYIFVYKICYLKSLLANFINCFKSFVFDDITAVLNFQ